MLKKILFTTFAAMSTISFAAETNASAGVATQTQSGYSQAVQDSKNNKPGTVVNSPTVSSIAASSKLFPDQDKLTGEKGKKYNTSAPKNANKAQGKSFSVNKSDNSNNANSPTVNSKMYSGAQFPQQNQVTGHKKQKYYNDANKSAPVNNPDVNSRIYSGAQFPQQNSFNNDGKTKKQNTAASGAI